MLYPDGNVIVTFPPGIDAWLIPSLTVKSELPLQAVICCDGEG